MAQNSGGHESLTIAHYFLFLLIFAALFVCWQMMRPYLNPVLLAIILAVLTGPIYEWLKKKTRGRENLAALLACVLLTLVIILPLLFLMTIIIAQGIHSFNAITHWVAGGNLEKLLAAPPVQKGLALIKQYLPAGLGEDFNLRSTASQLSSRAGKALMGQSGRLLSNLSLLVSKFFLMIFVFFFVVKDRQKMFDYVLHLMPLSAEHETILIDKIESVAKSAFLGSLVTALAQGIAGGIAFAICGLPGFFWGAVMAFSSLIPMVGTALIWVPASAYLFLSGSLGYGMFLVIWSVVVVGMIDNLVRPLFMKGSAGMSTVLIFFAILGGINCFGLTGLLYGPLVFGVTLVLLYIYELEFETFLTGQDDTGKTP